MLCIAHALNTNTFKHSEMGEPRGISLIEIMEVQPKKIELRINFFGLNTRCKKPLPRLCKDDIFDKCLLKPEILAKSYMDSILVVP